MALGLIRMVLKFEEDEWLSKKNLSNRKGAKNPKAKWRKD